jgi:hypothetical protein
MEELHKLKKCTDKNIYESSLTKPLHAQVLPKEARQPLLP